MKFLFISKRGRGLPIAYRLQQEGNQVLCLVKAPRSQSLWDGILEKTDNLEAALEDRPLVIFDEPGAGRKADELRSQGFQVFGAGALSDDLVRMRPRILKQLEESGLAIPPSVSFNSVKAVEEYVKSNPAAYSLSDGSGFVYAADTAEEMLYMLGYIRGFLSENPEITLERKLYGRRVNVINIVVDGRLAAPTYVAIEEDKPFTGGRAPENLASFGQAHFEGVPIMTEVNERIGVLFKDSGYCGFVKTEAIIGDRLYIQRITTGLIENAVFGILDQINGDVGGHIRDTASGTLKEMKVKPLSWYGAISLRVPGKDEEHPVDSSLPIYGVRRIDLPHVWMRDVQLDKMGDPVTVGTDTVALVVTRSGESRYMAEGDIRAILSRIRIPNGEYSTQALQVIDEGFSAVAEWVQPAQVLAMQHPMPPYALVTKMPDVPLEPVPTKVSETESSQSTDDNSGFN